MKGNIKVKLSIIITILLLSACTNTPVNIQKYNYSHIHTAVRLNQIETVKILVKNNKNINKVDKYGDSPLIDAVRNNYTDIALVLICNNANIFIKDKNNYTLMDMAIRNNNNELVRVLKTGIKSLNCKTKIDNKKLKHKENINNVIFIKHIDNKSNDLNIINNANLKVVKNEITKPNKYTLQYKKSKYEQVKKDDTFKIENEELSQSELNSYVTDNEITEINLDRKFSYNTKENINIKNNLINELSEITQKNIIFEQNNLKFIFYSKNKLNKEFKHVLDIFIPDLIYILKSYKDRIDKIEIKNYTSSEYRTKNTISEKFIANSNLSKKRADEISNYIIELSNKENFDTDWLLSKLVTYGMSSQNLIYTNEGIEDKIKSRRTEIQIILK